MTLRIRVPEGNTNSAEILLNDEPIECAARVDVTLRPNDVPRVSMVLSPYELDLEFGDPALELGLHEFTREAMVERERRAAGGGYDPYNHFGEFV